MRSKSVPNTILMIFGEFLEPPAPPKIEPKSKKSEQRREKSNIQKKHVFQHIFFTIFRDFDLRKRRQNRAFLVTVSKTPIL